MRDLWRLRGQVIAVAMVLGSGVAVLVMSMSTFTALSDTTAAYYERYRFADVFAGATRAPARVARRIATIPGVQVVQPRIARYATLDIEGFVEPAIGRLTSVPEDRQPRLNQLALQSGRWLEPGQRAIIERWGGNAPLAGRVRLVEPFGFTKISALGIEEQRVNVIIDLTSDASQWQRLAHGYQVDVRIVLAEADDTLVLPLLALFRVGPDWSVFVESDGRAELRKVEIGRRNSLDAEVLGGLEVGERVVLHPSDRVSAGVRIAERT